MDVLVRSAFGHDDAVEAARARVPDVVILSFDIGGAGGGLSLARLLRRQYDCAVIFCGSELPDRQAAAVAALEPLAFLCRPLRPEQLQATLLLALRRSTLPAAKRGAVERRSADFARALRQIAAVVSGTGVLDLAPDSPTEPSGAGLLALRPREQEVVRLLFEHVRVPGIAHRLGISPQTVRNHLKHIFQRLGVHSQQELIEKLRQPPADVASAHNGAEISAELTSSGDEQTAIGAANHVRF
jgi:DNA-binding NarL/FixJ family response regulator